MVEINPDPRAGGNRRQPDDGRDKDGRLPAPLDAAFFPPSEDDGVSIVLPGQALGQNPDLGPVLSAVPEELASPDVTESPADSGQARAELPEGGDFEEAQRRLAADRLTANEKVMAERETPRKSTAAKAPPKTSSSSKD
jgi:hypothetical protein